MPSSVKDIFADPISTCSPPSMFTRQPKHPNPPLSIKQSDLALPIQTNKFYANIFLGTQKNMVWTHPYGFWWDKQKHSIGISHIDRHQVAWGPQTPCAPKGTNSYYFNPVFIKSFGLSAIEFGNHAELHLQDLEMFSINVSVLERESQSQSNTMTMPFVQGQGFVTAAYNNLTPCIESAIGWTFISPPVILRSGVIRYKITMEDGNHWLVYGIADDGKSTLKLSASSGNLLVGYNHFNGIIQVGKIPQGNNNACEIYDAHAGIYAKSAILSGTVNGVSGSYSINYETIGSSPKGLLMFALPHHIASWAETSRQKVQSIELMSTTKGLMQAYSGKRLVLKEDSMPIDINWMPWKASGKGSEYTPAALQHIASAARNEIQQEISVLSNLNSMYFSGKILAKFAYLCLTVNDALKHRAFAMQCVKKLENAFARFAENNQIHPLNYDETYKGLVSSASYSTGDPLVDFGNSYYNDHHFHYGYFVLTAAIIGHIDPSWISGNKAYINTMVRDIANPSRLDSYFPQYRCFDWFHGHSWAKGIFESQDGKDEESTSEDVAYAFAIKLWGKVIQDSDMEARGNLMCAVLRRTLNSYFLLSESNSIEPPSFINNRASGIFFENKIDHTTYFGNAIEYIEGIHMLPLTPMSAYTRLKGFVQEEWTQYFASMVDTVEGGWRGLLYANLAFIDPVKSYQWFTRPNFDPSHLDDGASHTWYIALAAGLGGCA